MKRHPVASFAALCFGLTIAGAALLAWFWPRIDIVWAWLISITLITFLAYGYDKMIAATHHTRVPETILLALTLCGGTVGALVGMPVFRHKTIKTSFRRKLWLVIAIQVALLVAYVVWIKPAIARS
jgi:uncharacterized membrane protein YsdA (DUF1294 family)